MHLMEDNWQEAVDTWVVAREYKSSIAAAAKTNFAKL